MKLGTLFETFYRREGKEEALGRESKVSKTSKYDKDHQTSRAGISEYFTVTHRNLLCITLESTLDPAEPPALALLSQMMNCSCFGI